MVPRSFTNFRSLFIVIWITAPGLFSLYPLFGQLSDTPANITYDTNIHSVWIGHPEWEFSMPVIELNSEQKLELRFDDLSVESRSFGYTLVHCDINWKKSELPESEYLGGFGNGHISESRQSFNTTRFYVNYRLLIPEEECMPLLSGNYVLVVYDESDPERIILTRRFFITENSMKIDAAVRQPAYGPDRQTGQQLQFNVNFGNIEIRDPLTEITTIGFQNNRFDKQKVFKKPFQVRPDRMDFNNPEDGIFNAGNEFRSLDIKSMRYQTENVAEIEFRNPYYHVLMKPDIMRSNKPWFSKSDLNGNYYINKEKSGDRHTEADYVYVHFSLELPPVYSADKIFIAGAFNDWKPEASGRMMMNSDNGRFETTLLLKQGLYDYCFLMNNPETGNIDEYQIEGSFYETENDYAIFVYFHDQFKRYDRLTGYLPIK